MMTREAFISLLDLHGADLSRWPEDKVKAALACVENDAAARAAFDAALKLEDDLRHHPAAPVDLAALEGRIMAAVAVLPARGEAAGRAGAAGGFFRWRPAYIFAPSGGLFAAALIGFLMGMQPAIQQESLVNPVYYQAEQILADDSVFYDGGIF